MDEWSKVGLKPRQKVLPTGPFFESLRSNSFDVTVDFNCQGLVNPVMDVGKFLPHAVYTENYGNYEDQKDIDLYQQLLHEADPAVSYTHLDVYKRQVLRSLFKSKVCMDMPMAQCRRGPSRGGFVGPAGAEVVRWHHLAHDVGGDSVGREGHAARLRLKSVERKSHIY